MRAAQWFRETLERLDRAEEKTLIDTPRAHVITRLRPPVDGAHEQWKRTVLRWEGGTHAWLRKRGQIKHLRGWRVRGHHWPGGFGLGDMAAVALGAVVVLAGLVPPVLIGVLIYQDLDGAAGPPAASLGLPKMLWLLGAGVFLGKACEAAAWAIAMKENTFFYMLAYLYGGDLILGLGWLIFY
ncbi:hypothetical protein [Paractinoplanes atraurantiacus]|uniref:Uncharacterized protein n=1 Tax=Paractinoplanes atraurantiacus TaxID=1036182 RepID=A0A285IJB8_9ACTN|nr:hypothetical protein [Actinoplanes atraurantiacus]SNY48044.1 hypothetical protein SAMN05421748_108277 [Actinoplanes atraurantiacus]